MFLAYPYKSIPGQARNGVEKTRNDVGTVWNDPGQSGVMSGLFLYAKQGVFANGNLKILFPLAFWTVLHTDYQIIFRMQKGLFLLTGLAEHILQGD